MKEVDLTILMPCLNEVESLPYCIDKAKSFLERNKHIKGEILIADNGSTDGSIDVAKNNGARVINVVEKGYGSALINGIKNAKGKYIIMGDSDDTYDFLNLEKFYNKLVEGYDLVMGNRFLGGIEKGAMPLMNKYIGNPFLSFLAKKMFPCGVNDFHCGLRGFNKENILKLNINSPGMEFASEIVVLSYLNNYKITEIPTTLSVGKRTHKPHLRPFRDGLRHIKVLLKLKRKYKKEN